MATFGEVRYVLELLERQSKRRGADRPWWQKPKTRLYPHYIIPPTALPTVEPAHDQQAKGQGDNGPVEPG